MLHMLAALFLSTVSAAAPTTLASTTLVMPAAGDAIVSLAIDDSKFPAATGLDVVVDGEIRSTVLVFGKIGHGPYAALLHSLPAGRHDITAQPSPYWAWPAAAPAPRL